MEKITLLLIFLMVICIFTSCAENNHNESVIAEIKESLDENDIQVIIAFGDNADAKKQLIQSLDLHAEGLIALCLNPEPMNIYNMTIKEWFIDAIKRTELTTDQEIQIAKLSNTTYAQALLERPNLTSDGLVAICENFENLNLDNSTFQKLFVQAIERTELTANQQVQIAKLGKLTYNMALLFKTNLTGDALVTVCQNPGNLNLKNYTVKKLFVQAIERTELTANQQVQIAKLSNSTYNMALLFKTNLTGDGLVAVCENPGSMNIDNDTVQKWFIEAIQRTELTEEQKILIAKSKIKGLGLF